MNEHKVYISGLNNDNVLIVTQSGGNFTNTLYWGNGVHIAKFESGLTHVIKNGTNDKVVIKQIPPYPDALVFDGIDDNGKLGSSIKDIPINTVIMDFINLDSNNIAYDQRIGGVGKGLCLSLYNTDIAYNDARFYGGITYINGSLNNSISASSLKNKRHIATIVHSTNGKGLPTIGASSGSGYYSKIAAYRLLLFKEALTELQVKKVMYKYKLTKFDKI